MQDVQRARTKLYACLFAVAAGVLGNSPVCAQIQRPSKSPKIARSTESAVVIVLQDSSPTTEKVSASLPDPLTKYSQFVWTWSVRDPSPLQLVTAGAPSNPSDSTDSVSMSLDEQALVRVVLPNRERLNNKGKVTFEVHVPRPRELNPGVYRGEIEIEFKSETGNTSFDTFLAKYPVLVVAPGRAIRKLSFTNPTLSAGVPASLFFDIETIGCSLGDGKLVLQSWDAKQPRDVAIQLLVNSKLLSRGAFDPGIEFHGDKVQSVAADWLGTTVNLTAEKPIAIPINLPKSDDKEPDQPKIQIPVLERHRIQVTLGDCPRPGFLQGHLEWTQDPKAQAGNASTLKRSTPETKVSNGIWISSRVAYETELVDVVLYADGNVSNAPRLKAVSQSQRAVDIDLIPREQASLAGQSTYKTFEGQFTLDEPGRWIVGLPKDSQMQEFTNEQKSDVKLLAEQHIEPSTIDVCFQYAPDLDIPIEVFASTEPIWWPLYPNEYKAGGWFRTRASAMQFGANPTFLSDAKVAQIGWIEVLEDGRELPYDAKTATGPLLSLQMTGEKSDVLDVALADPQLAPKPAKAKVWSIPAKGFLPLDITVSLYPDNEVLPERHRLGSRQYVLQLLVSGVNPNKETINRIITQVIDVSVSTSWYYDLWLYLPLAGVVLLVLTVVGFHRLRTWKKAGMTKSTLAATHAVSHPGDEYSTRPDAPIAQQSNPSKQTGQNPKSAKPTPPPTEESGDSSDYLTK